jgi:regulator of extracellular matrix RemA (YlzA/DUF370 family)
MNIQNFSANSFIMGIVLGVICTSAWFLSKTLVYPPAASPESAIVKEEDGDGRDLSVLADATYPNDKSGAVSVMNQEAGDVVLVESVTVPPPGVWVAVREVADGKLGNVLGAMRVKGPRTEVSVHLLRDTVSDSSYAIQLYRDNGDNRFDLTTDSAYVDFDTGEPVVAPFVTLN